MTMTISHFLIWSVLKLSPRLYDSCTSETYRRAKVGSGTIGLRLNPEGNCLVNKRPLEALGVISDSSTDSCWIGLQASWLSQNYHGGFGPHQVFVGDVLTHSQHSGKQHTDIRQERCPFHVFAVQPQFAWNYVLLIEALDAIRRHLG